MYFRRAFSDNSMLKHLNKLCHLVPREHFRIEYKKPRIILGSLYSAKLCTCIIQLRWRSPYQCKEQNAFFLVNEKEVWQILASAAARFTYFFLMPSFRVTNTDIQNQVRWRKGQEGKGACARYWGHVHKGLTYVKSGIGEGNKCKKPSE